jgi:acyl-[acyl carrier protein]--UDP-N-acetylglucosamine O-acyltransferase
MKVIDTYVRKHLCCCFRESCRADEIIEYVRIVADTDILSRIQINPQALIYEVTSLLPDVVIGRVCQSVPFQKDQSMS